MLPSWARQTVTITPASWVDERGSKRAVYDSSSTYTVTRCVVQPAGSQTDLGLRDNLDVRYVAHLPPRTPVDRHCRVGYQGREYRINGAPRVWESPTGAASHIELELVDWEG